MSQFDQPVVEGAQVAIDEINKAGGVDGRKLKLVVADHKSDLNLVQQSALDVIDKGAKVVITTHDFDFGSPAAQVANSQGLLTLGGAGGMSYGRQGHRPARLQPLSRQRDRGRRHGPVRPRPGLQAPVPPPGSLDPVHEGGLRVLHQAVEDADRRRSGGAVDLPERRSLALGPGQRRAALGRRLRRAVLLSARRARGHPPAARGERRLADRRVGRRHGRPALARRRAEAQQLLRQRHGVADRRRLRPRSATSCSRRSSGASGRSRSSPPRP